MKQEFIFLFSPNNSGTTVMSQYISSLVKNSYLPPFGNNEGQNAPKLKSYFPKNRWTSKKKLDWIYIKSIWLELLEESKKSIFIEASPPNIIKVDEIFDCFKPKHYLFSISSPYSFIGSCLYNYSKTNLTKNRIDYMCNKWIQSAKMQIMYISKYGYSKEITTYESFCENPDSLIEMLFKNESEKDFYVNKSSEKIITGKSNDKFSKIINMQPKHLTYLGIKKINYISEKLSPYKEVLDFFNYKILDIKDVNNIISQNPIIALDGIDRRFSKKKFLKKRKKNK